MVVFNLASSAQMNVKLIPYVEFSGIALGDQAQPLVCGG